MKPRGPRIRRMRTVAMCIAMAAALLAFAGSAVAAGPVWTASQRSFPTNLPPGGTGSYEVVVANLAAAPAAGDISLRFELPDGVTASSAGDAFFWDCPTAAGASVVECTFVDANWQLVYGMPLQPFANAITLVIYVDIAPGASGVRDGKITVSGAGAESSSETLTRTNLSDERPQFGIENFIGGAFDQAGNTATQAGSHPNVTTDIQFNTAKNEAGAATPVSNIQDVDVSLPRGLVGDPTAVPVCPTTQLLSPGIGAATCAPETQVGVAQVATTLGGGFEVPVYNVEPPANSPGRFAFNLYGVIVNIDPEIRTGGDYGINAKVERISQTLTIFGTRLTLWGVPADPSHDGQRYINGTAYTPTSSAAPRRPFMTSPTECAGQSLVTNMTASSWQDPGTVRTAAFERDMKGNIPVVENCGLLRFDPGFEVRPESLSKRGQPAGLGIDLTVPQNENPDGLATSNLKTARVTLPEGMVVNPSSAQGLQGCAPEQIDIDGPSRSTCPNASKIGSIDIVTPLLDQPLRGGIYLASQRRNSFGTTIAIYLVAEGSGVIVKLPGRIDADPRSGRVTATFDDNPQLPFEKLSLHFDTGPRAPLSLPATCGPATTTAVLTPWSGTAPVTLNTSFEVSFDGNGAPCPPRGFTPSFSAGTINPVGGADTTFTLGVSRTDDDQELSGVTVDMPKGLLGRISSVDLCGEAQAAAGTCGEGSKVGNVTTAAGAGSNPIALPGRVYLTGPYKGAPYGLSIVVPAIAGPFDLGTVVVRTAIYVDRNTTQLKIVSDPLPTILEGIPLQIRLVEVRVDRPGFIFNPTNCTPASVGGQISSVAGAIANVANRFQASNCATLPFRPKMTLKVGAKGRTGAGLTTPLEVTLEMTRGQANNRVVDVVLPKALNSRLTVVNRRSACTIEQFRADRCPTVVGTGTAVTPLLRDPVRGPAYFVYNPARRLPDLVVRLKGQVNVDLTGKVSIPKNLSLQTTFDLVPDVPITKFSLRLVSGRNGPIGVVDNLCSARTRRGLKAALALTAQNGKKVTSSQSLLVAGCGRAAARARARARRGAARRATPRK